MMNIQSSTQLINTRATSRFNWLTATVLVTVFIVNSIVLTANANSASKSTQLTQHEPSTVHSIGGYANNTDVEKVKQQLNSTLAQQPATTIELNAFTHTVSSDGVIRNEYVSSSEKYVGFDIFSVSSQLVTDDDDDGYYHQFSITFDADVTAGSARVYAVLYLSKEGGPWKHYFTTDEFTIHGDSIQDSYEVFTTLADGYPSRDYDVLIDLYVVGDDLPVASVSADDSNELFSLPLEDETRDVYYQDSYYEEHVSYGGSLSVLAFLFLLLGVVLKRLNHSV